MSLKFKDEIDSATFDNLIKEDENVVYELSCLVSNIKKKVIGVLDFFSFLLKRIWRKKSYNMLSLMLNLKFKTFHLVSSRIGREQSKINVEKYDKISLFFIFWKWYYHLHPSVEFERNVVDQKVEGDINLDIFEMIANTSEPTA